MDNYYRWSSCGGYWAEAIKSGIFALDFWKGVKNIRDGSRL